MSRSISGLIMGSTILMLVVSAQADSLILHVPDWNQPNPANYPGNNLPVQIGGVDGYPDWCSPTAGGNIMGYWEDVMGCVGLTDQNAFPLTPAYPGTPLTWQQGLHHDGIIEMGWQMNTGGWGTFGGPFPPYRQGGTQLGNILPGLLSYASGAWAGKIAYPNVAGFTQNAGNIALAQMWMAYVNNIDASHPVEVSFDRWVNADLNIDVTLNGQTVHKYSWGNPISEGHSVVGVGYLDLTPQVFNGDEWFICQDGWGTTPQYVAVTVVQGIWQQNDYITAIPEPSTTALLVMGVVMMILVLNRRVQITTGGHPR